MVQKSENTYKPVCLASLLPDIDEDSTSIFLTDSTCIPNKNNLKDYYVYVGDGFPIKDGTKVLPVSSVVIDKSTPNPTDHNAMVITVIGEVKLNGHHKAVCVPKPKATPRISAICLTTAVKVGHNKQPRLYLYDTMYTSMKDCKEYSSDVNDADARIHVCGFDQRQGSMLSKGGSMLCKENGKWVEHGVLSYSYHTMEMLDADYEDDDMREREKPTVYVNVGQFRQLLLDSKSLLKYGRINLMRHR